MKTGLRILCLLAVFVLLSGCKKTATDTGANMGTKSPTTKTAANGDQATAQNQDSEDASDSSNDRDTEDEASKDRRAKARQSLGL